MFVFDQDRKSSLVAASKAMDEIARRRLPVTPEVFAVFYAVGAGKPEGLLKDLAELHAAGAQSTQEDILGLWHQHIGGRDTEATDRIVREFERLTAVIAEKLSGNDAAALEGAVADLARDIGAAGMPAKVRSSMLAVAQKASAVSRRDREISEDVQKSAQTIVELQAKLEEARKEAEAARAEARRDNLTNVGNRRGFDEAMERLFKDPASRGRALSLIVIDLDHFKQVNDTHGHKFGDQVLAATARRIVTSVRESGMVFRMGGEEFCILLPGVELMQARHIAERVRGALEARKIPEDTGSELAITQTVSCGVAERKSNDTAETLFKRADKGTYRAKEMGRNRVVQIN